MFETLDKSFAPDLPFDLGESGRLAARAGDLLVRLAESQNEIEAAQSLRYRVFYEEMQARPTEEIARLKRDFDSLDRFCDHLLVIDEAAGKVVGTYRLITRAMAAAHGGFYTSGEYDISKLAAQPEGILELGRSCVDAGYRTGATMQLLWRGIAGYALQNNIAYMFGCASLPGTDSARLALPLAYLAEHHLADEAIRPVAVADRYVNMRQIPPSEINTRRALAELPPLMKGYLRIGGVVGDGAVIDWEFNTTDVCIVVKTEMITGKYMSHYRRPA